METVSSYVHSASKMIWGEGNAADTNTQEPVSGQTGAGTATKPFDKGNEEAANIATSAKDTGASTMSSTTSTDPSTTTSTAEASSTTGTEPSTLATEGSTPNTGPSTTTTHGPSSTTPSSAIGSAATEGNTKAGGFGTAEPSVSADPASGAKPTVSHEGAGNPEDAPTDSQISAVKEQKEAGESAQSSSEPHKPITDEEREKLAEKGELPKIPGDHSGEPLHVHSEGAKKQESAVEDKVSEGKTDRSASVAHEGGGVHGKAKGTGEEHIKTTGMAADGGDFDATKPGAGAEANRLLEEKGIKKDDRGAMQTEEGSKPDEASPSGSVKESKMAKLKEKLHIGHGKV